MSGGFPPCSATVSFCSALSLFTYSGLIWIFGFCVSHALIAALNQFASISVYPCQIVRVITPELFPDGLLPPVHAEATSPRTAAITTQRRIMATSEFVLSGSRQHHRSRQVAWMIRVQPFRLGERDGESLGQHQFGQRIECRDPDRCARRTDVIRDRVVRRAEDPHERSFARQADGTVPVFHRRVRLAVRSGLLAQVVGGLRRDPRCPSVPRRNRLV